MRGGLSGLLLAACATRPKAPALADAARCHTYGELECVSGELAARLRAAGLRAAEPAVALVSNRDGDWIACLATWGVGGVLVPVHRNTPPAALKALLDLTGARFVVDPEGVPPSLLADEEGARHEGFSALDRPPLPPRPLLEDAALVVVTSGSTGRPKGAVLSHRALEGKLRALDSVLGFGSHTRTLLVLQITFSFGIWVSLLTLMKGGLLFLQQKFDHSTPPPWRPTGSRRPPWCRRC